MYACNGDFLGRAELVEWGTRVTMVTEFIPLRPVSHLYSKISAGKSPRLDAHQGWLVDYHRMLGKVEKKQLKLYWCVSQQFLKYLTERFFFP